METHTKTDFVACQLLLPFIQGIKECLRASYSEII